MNKNAKKHPFAPVFDGDSKVLILGSFPSQNSIEAGFYYGDLSNRFWDILGELFDESGLKGKSKDDKIAFLKSNHIALWDIWGYCYKNPQDSASDDSIVASESRFVDLSEILRAAKIQKIFTTIGGSENSADSRGGHFKKWSVEKWLWDNYAKYFSHCKDSHQIVCPLYSTSPLSKLRVSDEKMLNDYGQIKEILEK